MNLKWHICTGQLKLIPLRKPEKYSSKILRFVSLKLLIGV